MGHILQRRKEQAERRAAESAPGSPRHTPGHSPAISPSPSNIHGILEVTSPSATPTSDQEKGNSDLPHNSDLPRYNHNGHLVHKYIHPDGESGRSGFHHKHFSKVLWRSSSKVSMLVNVLWPFVPVAIALHFYGQHKEHFWVYIFATAYIAMVPCANLLGFAGQELARKLPKVAGILVETTLGSVVEIVLFMVLITKDNGTVSGPGSLVHVIQAAIIGSILTNLLLCMGLCFFIGGLTYKEQKFHSVISEVGSGILLVAGFALVIPSAFFGTLSGSTRPDGYTDDALASDIQSISHALAIILLLAFVLYLCYNAFSHDDIFNEVLEADEEADADRHLDLAKAKFTFTECIISIVFAIGLISLLAVILVEQIDHITERGVPDNFLGLILIPFVEKAAEHLTAVDEAYDNQINFALYHCLGPSVQTALLNAPLVVLVSWGLGKKMDLNFDTFFVVLLLLAILVVGNFLRDGESNYLEGGLLVIVYVCVAITAWYYPNPSELQAYSTGGGTQEATELVKGVAKALLKS